MLAEHALTDCTVWGFLASPPFTEGVGPMGGNNRNRQNTNKPEESRPMDQTTAPEPEQDGAQDQDLAQDPAEAALDRARENAKTTERMLAEEGRLAPVQPPPAVPMSPLQPEWAPPAAPPPPRPSALQMDVMRYGRLSGGPMTAKRQELDAQYGTDKVQGTIDKLVSAGILDAGHVITTRGREVLDQFSE